MLRFSTCSALSGLLFSLVVCTSAEAQISILAPKSNDASQTMTLKDYLLEGIVGEDASGTYQGVDIKTVLEQADNKVVITGEVETSNQRALLENMLKTSLIQGKENTPRLVDWPDGTPNPEVDASGMVIRGRSNDAPPRGGDRTINLSSAERVFSVADFPYSDPEGRPLAELRVDRLPTTGSLMLDGRAVTLDARISAAQLASGALKYSATARGAKSVGVAGSVSDSILFSVSDGTSFSATPSTISLVYNSPRPGPVDPTRGGGRPFVYEPPKPRGLPVPIGGAWWAPSNYWQAPGYSASYYHSSSSCVETFNGCGPVVDACSVSTCCGCEVLNSCVVDTNCSPCGSSCSSSFVPTMRTCGVVVPNFAMPLAYVVPPTHTRLAAPYLTGDRIALYASNRIDQAADGRVYVSSRRPALPDVDLGGTPRIAEGYYALGVSEYWKGNYEEAIGLLKDGINAYESDARLWYFKAFSEVRLGRKVDAGRSLGMAAVVERVRPSQKKVVSKAIERFQGEFRVQIERARLIVAGMTDTDASGKIDIQVASR
ncbi:secreted protein [Rhodopirellula sallentina SM41]|uniref:Secreted protein n=2 Tax=Rhodopirellula TaxID=265488 RepID=M5U240_9BACT|nr:secreted protein [Rhodopirellula sallentina SM41]